MNNSKQTGTILVVVAGAIGMWVYTRMTSFVGKMCSWAPPFNDYEIYTFLGAGLGLLLLLMGVRYLNPKDGGADNKPK